MTTGAQRRHPGDRRGQGPPTEQQEHAHDEGQEQPSKRTMVTSGASKAQRQGHGQHRSRRPRASSAAARWANSSVIAAWAMCSMPEKTSVGTGVTR